jgi:Poxvirus A32 protein
MISEYPFFLFMAAPPKSGKTKLVRSICYDSKDIWAYGLVFSRTAKLTDAFDFVKPSQIYTVFDFSKIKALMDTQLALKKGGYVVPQAFLIMDDMIDRNEWEKKEMVNFFSQYRHFNISVIISLQMLMKASPTIRTCASHVVIFKQTNVNTIKALHDMFGSVYGSYSEFSEFIKKYCVDYHFILNDVLNQTNNISEIYKVGRAPAELPKFQFMRKAFTAPLKT